MHLDGEIRAVKGGLQDAGGALQRKGHGRAGLGFGHGIGGGQAKPARPGRGKLGQQRGGQLLGRVGGGGIIEAGLQIMARQHMVIGVTPAAFMRAAAVESAGLAGQNFTGGNGLGHGVIPPAAICGAGRSAAGPAHHGAM